MMLSRFDRKITIANRADQITIIDGRSGEQFVYRLPKLEAKQVMAVTKTDMIVVDVATLEYRLEPKPVAVTGVRRRDPAQAKTENTEKPQREPKAPKVCKHLGPAILGEQFPPAEGLGDYISDGLKAIGITKERWSALVNQGKAEGVCGGCDGRQTFANWLGSKLGLSVGQGPLLQKMLAKYDIPPQPIHTCAVHNKCLPTIRNPELKEACEQAGCHLCHGCDDRELVRLEV